MLPVRFQSLRWPAPRLKRRPSESVLRPDGPPSILQERRWLGAIFLKGRVMYWPRFDPSLSPKPDSGEASNRRRNSHPHLKRRRPSSATERDLSVGSLESLN